MDRNREKEREKRKRQQSIVLKELERIVQSSLRATLQEALDDIFKDFK